MVLTQLVLQLVDAALFDAASTGFGPLGLVFSLGVFLPGLSVGVRRLHDAGRSGWWLLIYLVPIFGMIVILVFVCFKSQPGANRFGPNPLTGNIDGAEVFS